MRRKWRRRKWSQAGERLVDGGKTEKVVMVPGSTENSAVFSEQREAATSNGFGNGNLLGSWGLTEFALDR